MKNIVYIANYHCLDNEHYREATKAAATQSEYLLEVLAELGYKVELISTSVANTRKSTLQLAKGFTIVKNEKESYRYFVCIDSKYMVFRVIGRWLFNLSIRAYIFKNRNSIFLLYHSFLHYPYYRLLDKLGCKYIIEVEEIYSDVIQDKDKRVEELNAIRKANGYIIPNVMMVPEVTREKRWVLYHGTCKNECRMKKLFNDGKIHIVYAGTMDPRKIGDMPSLDAALYLDENYHIHILAVGYPENVKRIKSRINSFKRTYCQITFHDPLDGDEYLQFLQSCDIGLYTQNNDDVDINTSFPSKLMSYLSNGLRIVAARTEPLERSEIADILYFAKSNNGEDIADRIKSIDFEDGYNSREKLDEIHEKLKVDMKALLKEFS